ncbi:MAG TPA: NAD(P)-dependent alcohol dehydrogenase [Gammaproteobacteria bacterium]|nr:NAD(P)-dependent alcohol dehydrogenase [Gammaproteobacteria bacterium]
MLPTRAYAAKSSTSPLAPYEFERREVGAHDVLIEILYCGICHSDIHTVRGEWGNMPYPVVPGHEIVGRVAKVGAQVKKFKVGDAAGVGCMVDSCRTCGQCKDHTEQFCENGMSGTYCSTEQDKKTLTQGGYSSQIVVNEDFVLKINSTMPLQNIAPLLCAGITTYSPLKKFNAGPGKKVAVMGLGGLGHMAVKLAASMGADVTVLSHSPSKEKDAKKLGASHFLLMASPDQFNTHKKSFDLILNTVAGDHDLNAYLGLLKTHGTLVLISVPEKPYALGAFPIIVDARTIAGSLIGGIKETQEMLDYCAAKNIGSDIELIPVEKINEAYNRTVKGDVRYRFVIDMKTL